MNCFASSGQKYVASQTSCFSYFAFVLIKAAEAAPINSPHVANQIQPIMMLNIHNID